MTLEEAKLYLRVDNDDEDNLIQAFITAAQSYIEKTTGKTYDSENAIWNLAIKLLVAHWYDNRGVEIAGNLTKISYSIDALINHIAMCGDYS